MLGFFILAIACSGHIPTAKAKSSEGINAFAEADLMI
jgi:hypothetical protein